MIRRSKLAIRASLLRSSVAGLAMILAPTPAWAQEPLPPGAVGTDAHLFYKPVLNPGSLQGERLFDLNALVGKEAPHPQPVFLSFAASDCAPCRRELRDLSRLSRDPFAERGARFAVVIMDENPDDAETMRKYVLDEIELRHPVVIDGFQIIARKYGVQRLPHTVLVGPDAKISWVRSGYKGASSIDAMLEALERPRRRN
jgi:thiol-disulfide isomerase/thioredoxin